MLKVKQYFIILLHHVSVRRRAYESYHARQGQGERVQLELDAALTGRGERRSPASSRTIYAAARNTGRTQ